MSRILVVYASKHNSTAEIASAIGEVLQKSDRAQVDVRPVEAVEDLTPYDGVVLGSAVYMGQWQPGAADFLQKHEQELARKPVWLFSSGPIAEGDPNTKLNSWKFPEKLQPVSDRIKPRDVAVFNGKLDPAKLNWFERFITRMVKSPTGDFRDWNLIRSWATGIAQAL